jgi:6-phosphogluconolactonase/glucosamine-6-phosphate isomerase/deaminase
VKPARAETLVFSDRAALVQHAAALDRGAGLRAIAERGRFAIATCGADTTQRVFDALADQAAAAGLGSFRRVT